jgi:glycosyltransferase involved in cell wall biosynthesis
VGSAVARLSLPSFIPGLVSVITPTWRRHGLLMERCIPSVAAQTWPLTEHVIVSDGPDEELREKLAGLFAAGDASLRARFTELPGHDLDPHYGHHARLRGIDMAMGGLICYCDDDDALRPDHVALLAGALQDDPEAGFACSRMISHSRTGTETAIGYGALAAGNVGTPMIMHRREILRHGTWGPASAFEDWDLIARWLDAGIRHAYVDADTVDVWPSAFWGEGH